jgi:O-antigen biosynthesis protein WbqP
MKRSIDLAVAVTLAILLLPLMAVIGTLVFATDRGPVLHWSSRVGRHGRVFLMPKFRSMKAGTPQVATDRLSDPRAHLTPIGGVLRKLSLDELPQLWSVIRGDMSLVGPRPALYNQHELIAARRASGVDSLQPGITGWAQVNGRDELTDQEKLALDGDYLRRAGLIMDMRILALTVFRVVRRDGVAH